MTRVFKDLQIISHRPNQWPLFSTITGEIKFVHVLEDGSICKEYPAYLIIIMPSLEGDALVGTLVHELEHYDMWKLLKHMGIKPDDEKEYPEWVHSAPSYSPHQPRAPSENGTENE